MEWARSGDDVVVVLEPGEEIHTSLRQLADELGYQRGSDYKRNRTDDELNIWLHG